MNYLSIPKVQQYSRWSSGMDKWFHPILCWACDYLFIWGLKLSAKRSPREKLDVSINIALCDGLLPLADSIITNISKIWIKVQKSKISYILFQPQCVRVVKLAISLVSLLFVQVHVWARNKKFTKAFHYWPFVRWHHLTVVSLTQRACKAERILLEFPLQWCHMSVKTSCFHLPGTLSNRFFLWS